MFIKVMIGIKKNKSSNCIIVMVWWYLCYKSDDIDNIAIVMVLWFGGIIFDNMEVHICKIINMVYIESN